MLLHASLIPATRKIIEDHKEHIKLFQNVKIIKMHTCKKVVQLGIITNCLHGILQFTHARRCVCIYTCACMHACL